MTKKACAVSGDVRRFPQPIGYAPPVLDSEREHLLIRAN